MKKIISLILAMVLLGGCLVGCGKKEVSVIKVPNDKEALAKMSIDRVYDLSAKEFINLFNKNLPDSKWKIGELKQGQTTDYLNYQSYDYGDGFSILLVTLKDGKHLCDARVVANTEKYDASKFEQMTKHLVQTLDSTLTEDQQAKLWDALQINNSKKWNDAGKSNLISAKGIHYFVFADTNQKEISFMVSPIPTKYLDLDQIF